MSKRDVIEPNEGDKRYGRREAAGKFGKQIDGGRSHASDQRRAAQATAKPGQGDRGDRNG